MLGQGKDEDLICYTKTRLCDVLYFPMCGWIAGAVVGVGADSNIVRNCFCVLFFRWMICGAVEVSEKPSREELDCKKTLVQPAQKIKDRREEVNEPTSPKEERSSWTVTTLATLMAIWAVKFRKEG